MAGPALEVRRGIVSRRARWAPCAKGLSWVCRRLSWTPNGAGVYRPKKASDPRIAIGIAMKRACKDALTSALYYVLYDTADRRLWVRSPLKVNRTKYYSRKKVYCIYICSGTYIEQQAVRFIYYRDWSLSIPTRYRLLLDHCFWSFDPKPFTYLWQVTTTQPSINYMLDNSS
jgi:hypothetical protein